jgi:glycosyltransferase involved in cell wall biosynthesis
MKISIIIPTFNRAHLIKFTLDSLVAIQKNGIDLEVIVVDDGSTDDTFSVIEQYYPWVALLKNKGKGAGSARNTGLAAARGRYIMYLDSDDLVGENYFTQKLALMELQADLDGCYGSYDYFESDGAFDPAQIYFKHKYPVITSPDKTKEHLVNYLGGNFLPLHSIIWRKEFLLKCGGHDTALSINQDVDLFIRAIFNGLRIIGIQDDTKVYTRDHSIDKRVGTPHNDKGKWVQMLELSKRIFKDLKKYGYGDDEDCYSALSSYLFGYWKKIRHSEPEIAGEYLKFAKEVYWPVKIKGGIGIRLLAKIFGPVAAMDLKYFLLKRD